MYGCLTEQLLYYYLINHSHKKQIGKNVCHYCNLCMIYTKID